ncbi:hypothetical protein E2562_020166 [Oryza meyeriana var. granulata]|uniref:Uncharacterized protein n=1 Tax=Oryza meyeriana var. granulata TaxID=110450 RepID=A0A6G1BLM9_9ORYZ|nr:hypothetical protein E2562_020166 [Oryza meyeriana var. granulata]
MEAAPGDVVLGTVNGVLVHVTVDPTLSGTGFGATNGAPASLHSTATGGEVELPTSSGEFVEKGVQERIPEDNIVALWLPTQDSPAVWSSPASQHPLLVFSR